MSERDCVTGPDAPFEERVVDLLSEIRTLLAVLSAAALSELESELNATVLKTPGRISVYQAIDGTSTSEDIAKSVGLSLRRVQEVLQDLCDQGVVGMEKKGRSYVPQRDAMRVVRVLDARRKGAESK